MPTGTIGTHSTQATPTAQSPSVIPHSHVSEKWLGDDIPRPFVPISGANQSGQIVANGDVQAFMYYTINYSYTPKRNFVFVGDTFLVLTTAESNVPIFLQVDMKHCDVHTYVIVQ